MPADAVREKQRKPAFRQIDENPGFMFEINRCGALFADDHALTE